MNKLQKPRASLESVMRTRVLCSTRSYQQHYQPSLLTRPISQVRLQPAFSYPPRPDRIRHVSYEQKAKDLNQKGVDNQLDGHDARIAEDTDKQRQAPWHREGSDKAPVHTQRQASAMTKGKEVCTQRMNRDTYATR